MRGAGALAASTLLSSPLMAQAPSGNGASAVSKMP
jgi:hypothetical protein